MRHQVDKGTFFMIFECLRMRLLVEIHNRGLCLYKHGVRIGLGELNQIYFLV